MIRSYFQQCMVQLARLKMQSRTLHLDLDTERRQREVRRTHVDQLQLTHENLLYQRAHVQREIEKCKDLPTPNIDEIQREMGCALGTVVFVDNLEEINQRTLAALESEKEARISMKRKLDALEADHAKGLEELQRKRKYLDDIPDQVGKIRATSKELAEDLTSIVKEIRERNKRKQLELERATLPADQPQGEEGDKTPKEGVIDSQHELLTGDENENGVKFVVADGENFLEDMDIDEAI